MSELQVIHNPLVQPISLADAVGQWSTINNHNQQAATNAAQEQRLTASAPLEQKTNELKFNAMQHTALKSVATDFMSAFERQSQKLGIAPDSPQGQQLANSLYVNGYNDTIRNITGKSYQAGTNIDLNAMASLSGLTPSEENTAKLQQKKQELDLEQPYKENIAQITAGGLDRRQNLALQHQDTMQQNTLQHQDTMQQNSQDFQREQAALKAEHEANQALKVSPSQRMGFIENHNAISKINSAINQVIDNPSALGLKNMLGDSISQRVDPNGVSTRALVADISSLKLHDRTGSVVTTSEEKRLLPFIPSVTDTPETIVKKLKQFKTEYENINNDLNATYKGAFNDLPPIMPELPSYWSKEAKQAYLQKNGFLNGQ
jgi:hypothetical protein